MSSFFNQGYNTATVINRRSGSSSDPFVPKSETIKIVNARIVLTEIPNYANHVTVTGLTDTVYEGSVNGIASGTTFIVDYTQGIVTFDSKYEGQNANVSYMGTGVQAISASRIWTQVDSNNNITQTLKELADNAQTQANSAQTVATNLKVYGAYNASTAYGVNMMVQFNNAIYICTQATTGNDPSNGTYWRKVTPFTNRGVYSTGSTYSNGDFVVDTITQDLYMCLIDGTTSANGLNDATHWQPIIVANGIITTLNTTNTNATNAENTRISNESTRVTSENARLSSETTRQGNETNRQSQEVTRQANETTRQNTYASGYMNWQAPVLTKANLPASPQNGWVVQVTSDSTSTNNGFYRWNGTAWIQYSNINPAGTETIGNVGTVDQARADIIRQSVMSGVVDYVGGVQVGNVLNKNGQLWVPEQSVYNNYLNGFALGNTNTYMNGFKSYINGGSNSYVPIFLQPAPAFGTRDDLVFLEAWFPTGNAYQMSWRIRVVAGVDFGTYSYDGFSAGTSGRNPNITAQGANSTPVSNPTGQTTYSFNRGDLLGFNNDVGLYVAGDGTSTSQSTLQANDGYVYAIPLFRVKRRNSGGYRKDNLNGAREFIQLKVTTGVSTTSGVSTTFTLQSGQGQYVKAGDRLVYQATSTTTFVDVTYVNGDTITGVPTFTGSWNNGGDWFVPKSDRPDSLYSNIIDATDIIDLRHKISLTGFNYDQLREQNFDLLAKGQLTTKDTQTTVKEQYGLRKAPLGISQDLQTINIKRPFYYVKPDGITQSQLVNLLGDSGNCDTTASVTSTTGSLVASVDRTNFKYGNASILLSSSTISESGTFKFSVTASQYYIAVYDLKLGAGTWTHNIKDLTNNVNITSSQSLSGLSTSSFGTYYLKFSTTANASDCRIYINNTTTTGTNASINIDGVRVYQIDQATYNAIDDGVTTGFQGASGIQAKFPYVDSTIQNVTFKNLLGVDGNFEGSALGSNLGMTGASYTQDTLNSVYGASSAKFAITSGSTAWISVRTSIFDPTKYYLGVVSLKNGNLSNNVHLKWYTGTTNQLGTSVTDTTKFTTVYKKVSPSDFANNTASFYLEGSGNTIGQYFYADGFRIYEITQDVYNLIDVDPNYTGSDKISILFPYVDSYPTFVENLCPSFDSGKWVIGTNTTVNSSTQVTINATSAGFNVSSVNGIGVVSSTKYTLSMNNMPSGAYAEIYRYDSSGTQVGYNQVSTPIFTFTTESTAVSVKIDFTNSNNTGTFAFSNIQFEASDHANPFVPYGRWYLPSDSYGNSQLVPATADTIFHYEGTNGGKLTNHAMVKSDAQTSVVVTDIVESLATPQSHLTVTQATVGQWSVNDTIKVTDYDSVISGVIDADTGLARVVVANQSSTSVYVDDVSKFTISDQVRIYNPSSGYVIGRDFNISAIDTINKILTLDGLNTYYDTKVGDMVVETTASTSSPSVTATGIAGTWSGLGTKQATYTITTAPTTNTSNIVIQYSVNYPAGKGLTNLPDTVLKAEVNGQSLLDSTSGVSVKGNFLGKVVGNTDLIPHIAKYRGGTSLDSPALFTNEVSSVNYSNIVSLDNTTAPIVATNVNEMVKMLFQFDMIRLIEDKYGEIPADGVANKITWLNNNVSSFVFNWSGYGSNVNGNKATVAMWVASSSSWSATKPSTTNGTVTTLGYASSTNSLSTFIDSNGFLYGLAYADPAGAVANPTVAPTLSASGTGYTLSAGTYYVTYTWYVSGSGETLQSPESSITVANGQQLLVTIPSLPFGVSWANIYVSTSSGTETKQGTSSGTFTISAPITTGSNPPASNTAIVPSTIYTDYVEISVNLNVAETGYTVFQPDNKMPVLSENLLTRNQALPVDASGFITQGSPVPTFSIPSIGVFSVTSNVNGNTGFDFAVSSATQNTYYTFSADIQLPTGKNFKLQAYDGNTISYSQLFTGTGSYQRVNWTYKLGNSTTLYFYVMMDSSTTVVGDVMNVKNLKVQQGSQATPWTEGRRKSTMLNYLGKVAGMSTPNPNRYGARTSVDMPTPVNTIGTNYSEYNTTNYNNISEQDGTLSNMISSTSGNYAQQLFEFDLSHFGLSLSQLKSALRKLTVNWTGYGSGTSNPQSAPTLATATTGGALVAGTYYVKYTWVNATGGTQASPEASIIVPTGTSTNTITVTIPALPSGFTSANVYISTATGTETLQGNTTSTTYTQSVVLVAGTALPVSNTSGVTVYGAKYKVWNGVSWDDSASSASSSPSTISSVITNPVYVTNNQKVYILVHSTTPSDGTIASNIYTDYVSLQVDLADYVDYVKGNVIKVRQQTKEIKTYFPLISRKLVGGGANEDNIAVYYKYLPPVTTQLGNATMLTQPIHYWISTYGSGNYNNIPSNSNYKNMAYRIVGADGYIQNLLSENLYSFTDANVETGVKKVPIDTLMVNGAVVGNTISNTATPFVANLPSGLGNQNYLVLASCLINMNGQMYLRVFYKYKKDLGNYISLTNSIDFPIQGRILVKQ